MSRRTIHLAIQNGTVTVNGRPARKGQHVGPDDRIDVGALIESPPVPSGIDVAVLHADAAIIVLDKPPGVPVPARRLTGSPSIAGYLLDRFPELADVGDSPLEAGLVHRLDTGTSGVLLAARTRAAWLALRGQFRRRLIQKEYLAFIHGQLRAPQNLSHTLAHDPHTTGRMQVVPTDDGPRRTGAARWQASATITPLAVGRDTTLVRVDLKTGVTHQIRVQLAAIGYPVVGDRLYGGFALGLSPPERFLLHAARIGFRHPTRDTPLRFRSPLPIDFASALARFGEERKTQEDSSLWRATVTPTERCS